MSSCEIAPSPDFTWHFPFFPQWYLLTHGSCEEERSLRFAYPLAYASTIAAESLGGYADLT